METVKEKLYDLLVQAGKYAQDECINHPACNNCKHDGEVCDAIESYLIQNGVTIVKTAKMEIKTDDYDCEYMMCTSCGEEMYPADEDTVDVLPKYCPNCGARIEGKA